MVYVPVNYTLYCDVTPEKRMLLFLNTKFSFTIYLKFVMLYLFLELADLRKQIEEEIRASVRTTYPAWTDSVLNHKCNVNFTPLSRWLKQNVLQRT